MNLPTHFRLPRLLAGLALALAGSSLRAYDPLAIPADFRPETLDLEVLDEARSRTIPVRVYLPPSGGPSPVVLFSHGLGGSREGCSYLGQHWSARGYVAVFLQHPGSDSGIWQDEPLGTRRRALEAGATGANFMLRVKDVPAVLDALEVWGGTMGHPLEDRLDLERVGMSGHSFGAMTTQAVSGQAAPGGRQAFTDERIDAAIALSPSSPRRGRAGDAFAGVAIPWLLMTGTLDVAPIGDQDVASRLAVYPALPPGSKYELVLDGAEHSAFTDRALPGDAGDRNPNHHRVILALGTAFWDAYLSDNPEAREWLDGSGPASILEADDRWQRK